MRCNLTYKKLTIGYLLRHAPTKNSAGLEAAIIDVAQDFMLKHLAQVPAILSQDYRTAPKRRLIVAVSH